MKYSTAKEKADKLLKLEDSLGKDNPAESRRVLRKCLHFRRIQKISPR